MCPRRSLTAGALQTFATLMSGMSEDSAHHVRCTLSCPLLSNMMTGGMAFAVHSRGGGAARETERTAIALLSAGLLTHLARWMGSSVAADVQQAANIVDALLIAMPSRRVRTPANAPASLTHVRL